MRVSAIIPVYNREALVGRAIESVLAQEGGECELIVVDDGSTDGTPRVLAGYGQRIVAVRQENAGRSAARNAGLSRASGELVAFLDSDDAWAPNKLAVQVAFHAAHPELLASATGIRVVRPDGSEEQKPPRHDPAALRERPYETLMDQFAFFPSAVMARRAEALEVGGFGLDYHGAEDMDFALKLARQGPLGVLPECLTVMFQHGGNTDRRQLAVQSARVLRRHLVDYALEPALRDKLTQKIARYLVSVAKRTDDPAARAELLDEAVATDPSVRRRISYLKVRWFPGRRR